MPRCLAQLAKWIELTLEARVLPAHETRSRMANYKNPLLMAAHLMGVNEALAHWNRGKIRTLIYHNVVPDTTAFPYALTPAEFERQIVLIKKKYNSVHLDQNGAIVAFAPHKINILLTFDDGFINNYEYVFPILIKHGLKATFFLIVDCVETGASPVIAEHYSRATAARTEYRTVSLPQIQEMMAAGMTFGSHTFSHSDLTHAEWAEGISIARGSAEKLRALLGCDVKLFAFPWGRYKPGQPEALAGSFGRVFTTDHGFNWLGDVVMRRDEAVNDLLHWQFVVCGARDLLSTGRKAVANAWGRNVGRALRSEKAHLPGRFNQFNRSEAINPNSKSKPLIAFVLPSLRVRRRRDRRCGLGD